MAQVHPSAIVDDRAQLADDAIVGPQCILEGNVTIGPGTLLMHRVSMRGPLTIGANNTIYPNAVIGYEPQDRKFSPDTPGAGTIIGDDNIFREGFTIHRATGEKPTTLGSGGYYMANSHVGHDCVVGDEVMFANGALLGGHVAIGDNVIIGGNGVVHQSCRVGRMAMIAGIRGVNKDLPPFCVVFHRSMRVDGLNLVGLRRAGHRDQIPALKRCFDLFFHQALPARRAIERIEADEQCAGDLVGEFVAFVRGNKRGVTPGAGNEQRDESIIG